MHQHQIVAQILLIFSILNSALAAPAVLSVREMRGERSVVAVRVPTEGVVAVLEKRPFDPEWETSEGSSRSSPETSETQSTIPETSETQSTSPEQPKPQPTRPPKRISTRPKIMTPEKIKSTKIVAGIALLTSVVLSLVDINVSLQNTSSSR